MVQILFSMATNSLTMRKVSGHVLYCMVQRAGWWRWRGASLLELPILNKPCETCPVCVQFTWMVSLERNARSQDVALEARQVAA
jgi:hypothetical protein